MLFSSMVGVGNRVSLVGAYIGGGRWKLRTWKWRTKLRGIKMQDM